MQRSSRAADALFILMICLAVTGAFLTRSPYNVPVPQRDSGIFIHIGSQVLQGMVLYRDTWINTQPLLYVINALGLWLGGGSMWGVWGLETALFCLAAAACFRILRKALAPLAAFTVTLTSFWAVFQLILANYSEEYAAILQAGILALLFLVYLPGRGRLSRPLAGLGMGILAGLVFCLKPTYIDVAVSVIALLVMLAWLGRVPKAVIHAALVGAGFLAVNAAVFLYFALHGALDDYIADGLLFNTHYVKMDLAGRLHSLLETLEFLYASPFFFALACLWLGLVIFLLVLWKRNTGPRHGGVKTSLATVDWLAPGPAILLFLGLLNLPLVVLSIALSGRNFGHYYISLFPAAFLLFGAVVTYLHQAIRQPAARTLFQCLLAAVLLFGSYEPALQIATYLREPGVPDERADVAEYLRANTGAEDKILVWGWESIIYFLAGREPPTRYALQFPAYLDTPYRQAALETIQKDLLADPPAFIVDTLDQEMPFIRGMTRDECLAANPLDGDRLHAIINFVCANYTLATVIDGYQVYQLTD